MIKSNNFNKGIMILLFLMLTLQFFGVSDNHTDTSYVRDEIIIKLKKSAVQNLQQHLLTTDLQAIPTTRGTTPVISTATDAVLRENGVTLIKPLVPEFYHRMKEMGKTADELRRQMLNEHYPQAVKTRAVTNDFQIENYFILKVDADGMLTGVLKRLNELADVEYAVLNSIMTYDAMPDDPFYTSVGSWGQTYDDLWGLKKIQSEQAWTKSQGEGIVVAVVDTGIDYTHEDLKDNMWVNTGEIPGNNIDDDNNGYVDDIHGFNTVTMTGDPSDDVGHGTHCAGTIAAVGNNNLGVVGVAPKAKLMAVKVLEEAGSPASTIIKGLYYAIENGADILSCSWGGTGSPAVYKEVFDYAYSLGILSVTSAGNASSPIDFYTPANVESVLAVSAVNPNGTLASFSNYGDKVDVAAPGVEVLSTMSDSSKIALDRPQNMVQSGYYRLDGTSMACPHVAGLAALLMAHYPETSFTNYLEAIRSMIYYSSTPFTTDPGKPAGNGIINASNAFNTQQFPDMITPDNRVKELEGNGNTIVESFETFALTVRVKNRGLADMTGLKARIESSDYFISGLNNTPVIYGDVKQGQTRENTNDPFIISLNQIPVYTAKNDTYANFTITFFTDAGYEKKVNIRVMLGAKMIYQYGRHIPNQIKISDEKVLWIDTYAGINGLYAYDRKKEVVEQLAPWGVNNINLADHRVVFDAVLTTTNSKEILFYDMSTDEYVHITDASGDQKRPHFIGDNTLIWTDERNPQVDLYMYDLTTKQEIQLTNTPAGESYVVTCDTAALWMSDNTFYLYEAATGNIRPLPLDYTKPTTMRPAGINDSYIAYNKGKVMYLYNYKTGALINVSNRVDIGYGTYYITGINDSNLIFYYTTDPESKVEQHYYAYNIKSGALTSLTGFYYNNSLACSNDFVAWNNKQHYALYLAQIDPYTVTEHVNLSVQPETKVFTSSQYSAAFNKQNAVDGNAATVWGSALKSTDALPFIYLDLGKSTELTKLVVDFFEGYHASSLIIGVSNDMKQWHTAKITSTTRLDMDLSPYNLSSRYIGIQCLEGPGAAYGIKEFEVWGNRVVPTPVPIPSPTPAGVPVTFTNVGLEKAVRYNLTKPEGPIYSSELDTLTEFAGNSFGITDLNGLEHCTNLVTASFSKNAITSLAPLKNNTKLEWLYVNENNLTHLTGLESMTDLFHLAAMDNEITDITGLKNSHGLTNLDLGLNKISDISPLADLTKLRIIYLGMNTVKDLSPLADHMDIFTLYINVNNMLIKDDGGQGTINLNVVNTLISRGANVHYTMGNIIK